MTILSALGARALQTPSYPLGQQGNGKTSALSATQPAGGTASPVSLSDDGIDPSMILGTFLFEWDRHLEFTRPRADDHDEAALEMALAGK